MPNSVVLINDSVKADFLQIIKDGEINTVFQPIISLRDGTLFGYEALSRGPRGSAYESPSVLFNLAYNFNMVWQLEYICRIKALQSMPLLPPDTKLFLNVNPNIIHDKRIKQGMTKEYLSKYSINSNRIIFEITEREAIYNISDFKKTVLNYKQQDYQIAIDDAGSGYSGLNLITEINPDFIKLDMNLVRNVDTDDIKQSMIKSMLDFGMMTNTKLIAEGIETYEELKTLISLGIHYGQGFYIQRPAAEIFSIKNDVRQTIKKENEKKNRTFNHGINDFYIKNIAKKHDAISPNVLVAEVYNKVKEDSSIAGFCITENDVVVGVLTRNDILSYTSGIYGYDLFSKKPVKKIMSRDFMSVDCNTSIDIVSKLAMQRDYEKIYDFITINREGKYYGIVTIKDLLEKTIQIEVQNAKHLNPLSGLPGNIVIEQNIEECVNGNSKSNLCIIYLDLDNFKAYNDVYGFERGDGLIRYTRDIIVKNIPIKCFKGHIGGDDFVAIISSDDAEQICKNIITDFDKGIYKFYSDEDYDNKYIITLNRKGKKEKFPLVSISVAGLYLKNYDCAVKLISDIAFVKKLCKEKEGSNFLIK